MGLVDVVKDPLVVVGSLASLVSFAAPEIEPIGDPDYFSSCMLLGTFIAGLTFTYGVFGPYVYGGRKNYEE